MALDFPNAPTVGQQYVASTSAIYAWDGAVWIAAGTTTAAPPPSGAASGDLTGTYPGPTIGALKVTDAKVNDVAATKLTGTIAQARFPVAPSGLLTANVNDAQITDVKIAGMAYSKLTGAPTIPTTLPPSGTAGGDLAGTYPNPTIGPGAVGNAEISDVAYSKVTGAPTIPTTLPPNGAAGGDLSGTYPNPQLLAGTIVDADVSASAAIQYTKLAGVPTSLPGPPTGAASGSLAGSYPGPTLTTTGVAAGTYGTTAKIPQITLTAEGRVSTVTELAVAPTGGSPTGAAGGSLAGSYPNPTLATTGVTAGTKGTQYNVAQITVTAEGRITALTEVLVRARWG